MHSVGSPSEERLPPAGLWRLSIDRGVLVHRVSRGRCRDQTPAGRKGASSPAGRERRGSLLRLHGCTIVERTGGTAHELSCGTYHLTVLCSSADCPEAGWELARRRALARAGCTVLGSLGPSTYQVSCGVHAFVVFCNSVECYEVDTELTRRWQKALRSRHGCRLIRRLGYPSSKCFAGIIA